eukprot:TRINITY_DN4810_c0_g1_i10.p1 TRINITY_DN4810_c0_g1~~TRINITY_DN4810_c0_g1_i10.p1  ORF type:complete len:243 (-),score=59.95 TRINITY_DN4810_c0_g1_i10:168-896(-)
MDTSKKGSKYSVILPTYNERENLPIIVTLILEMAEKNKLDFEIVIVEDNSPDGTLQVAKELQRINPGKINILERAGKLGLGSAYVDGIKKCSGDFVIIMDADFSHHPKYIPQFIERQKQTNADIVSGTRYLPGGGVFGWNFERKLVSRCANFIAASIVGQGTSDLTGSFRLYKREVIARIIPEIASRGYAFQMEIVIRAAKYGYKIEEVPIVFVDRIFGESKLGSDEVVIYLKGIWSIIWKF